jgi:hypothetical protein
VWLTATYDEQDGSLKWPSGSAKRALSLALHIIVHHRPETPESKNSEHSDPGSGISLYFYRREVKKFALPTTKSTEIFNGLTSEELRGNETPKKERFIGSKKNFPLCRIGLAYRIAWPSSSGAL